MLCLGQTPPPLLPLTLQAGQWPLMGARGHENGGMTHTAAPATGLLPGAPSLFGGMPSGTPAVLPLHMPPHLGDIILSAPLADANGRAGMHAVGNGNGVAVGHPPLDGTAAMMPLLWQQFIMSGGALGGAAFHRKALKENPKLYKPTPIRANASTWGMIIKSASMPELGAAAQLEAGEDDVFPPLRPLHHLAGSTVNGRSNSHGSNGHMASIAEGGDPTSSG